MPKTINEIVQKKQKQKITVVTSYDYTMATLCDQVDILLVVACRKKKVKRSYNNKKVLSESISEIKKNLQRSCLLYTSDAADE